jgi:hypothetical protein
MPRVRRQAAEGVLLGGDRVQGQRVLPHRQPFGVWQRGREAESGSEGSGSTSTETKTEKKAEKADTKAAPAAAKSSSPAAAAS